VRPGPSASDGPGLTTLTDQWPRRQRIRSAPARSERHRCGRWLRARQAMRTSYSRRSVPFRYGHPCSGREESYDRVSDFQTGGGLLQSRRHQQPIDAHRAESTRSSDRPVRIPRARAKLECPERISEYSW
jgi:hypothetical protein